MANHKAIIPFIKKWEGGLSKAKTDSASKTPVPDGSGYHTNKGVTWKTLDGWKVRLGITNLDALIKTFYAMPDAIWEKVYKWGYWDAIRGDEIKSQAAADILVDWAWGAGPGRAIEKLQDFLKLTNTFKMDNATLQALNNATTANEATFIKDFADFKLKWYTTLPGQEPNYKGWTNRLNDLYKVAVAKVGTGGSIVATIGIAVGFFFS
jgi:lysozyme family protein